MPAARSRPPEEDGQGDGRSRDGQVGDGDALARAALGGRGGDDDDDEERRGQRCDHGYDSHEDLLASSEAEQVAMSGFLPEMSSPLDHTYDSPYSFFSQASSGIHPLDPASSSQQGLQEAFPLPTHLDTGHFHDFFAHDVFPNCGYEYEFNAGH